MVDANIAQVVKDLFVLRRVVSEAEGSSVAEERAKEKVFAYLGVNEPILRAGLAAYGSMSELERGSLQREHRELDYSAVMDGFLGIAEHPLWELKQELTLDYSNVSEDHLHMLQRALEFAKYRANTSLLKLHMQPIENYVKIA